MGETKWTPGPWHASQILDDGRWGIDSEDGIIVGANRNLNEENARLIAAAPELLEACHELLDALHDDPRHEAVIASARAAIRKAEGREP